MSGMPRAAVSRRTVLLGLAAGLALPLAGCARTSPTVELTMACGEPGGRYVQFGELLRDAMGRRGGATLGVVTTNGSADNIALLDDGTVDLAIALSDTAAHAAEGKVAIGRVYQNYLQCIVRAGGPIGGLNDLAGRPVSIGAPGSGSSFTTRRLLAAAGIDRGAGAPLVSEHTLDEALLALVAGSIDALFWSGGIPTPQIDGIVADSPLALLDLSPAIPALEAAHPDLYLAAEVPAGVYGLATPTPTVGIPNDLLAREDLADDVARTLVDVLIGDARELVPDGTVGVQYLTPANLIDTGTVPLHPAARQRYDERYG